MRERGSPNLGKGFPRGGAVRGRVPLVLYRLPGSHYCERAEALLQIKGIPYERRTLTYFESVRVLPREVGDDTVPAIKSGDGEVVRWHAIPRWIEVRHPEPSMYPGGAREREDVERWEDDADLVVGHAVRRLGYWAMRDDHPTRRRFFRVRNPIGEARSLVLLRYLMRAYGATDWQRAHDVQYLATFLARVETALDRSGGRHLVGDRLTAADVAVATLLHPIADAPVARALDHKRAWAWVRATRSAVRPVRPGARPVP